MYQHGVSGPFWYASGATIQIFLFRIIAIELKRKASTAHTMTEIVLACVDMITNVIVTSMLLLGGAAVVNALTGMNIYAALFLIPVGVIIYTTSGGLKATFFAPYVHTAVIMVILTSFVSVVYMASDDLGSPSKVHNNLQNISSIFPVKDNEK